LSWARFIFEVWHWVIAWPRNLSLVWSEHLSWNFQSIIKKNRKIAERKKICWGRGHGALRTMLSLQNSFKNGVPAFAIIKKFQNGVINWLTPLGSSLRECSIEFKRHFVKKRIICLIIVSLKMYVSQALE